MVPCEGSMSTLSDIRLPAPVRLANAIGTALRRAGLPLFRLDPDVLLETAARRTGLADFGDDCFREPLRRLIESLESEARLTPLGRYAARADLLRLLENRLRMRDEMRRHPEMCEAEIRAPLFILGLPRTGTSILHELLAQDPDNRVPMSWEVMYPWPPPESATYDTDPRIEQTDRHLNGIDRLIPSFKSIHPMGARLPQECVALTAHDFATMVYHTTHNVPSYQRWLEQADLVPVYRSHRRQLQYLQWRCPARRWVLKSPGHLWALDALLQVYPDARIVQTHRDPLEVLASLVSLIRVLRRIATDHVDPLEIGRDWAVRLAAGLNKTMAVRAGGALRPEQVFDLDFRSFVGNEIASIRRIYSHFGMELSDEAEARMRRFLADNPRDKHGTHRYALEQFGLDPATERTRFAEYIEKHMTKG